MVIMSSIKVNPLEDIFDLHGFITVHTSPTYFRTHLVN